MVSCIRKRQWAREGPECWGIKEGEEQLLVSWGFQEKVLFKLSLEG